MPRWHSDPQAVPCRIRARKHAPRLPRRSAARCNPINAVSRLCLSGQSGSHREKRLVRGSGVFQETGRGALATHMDEMPDYSEMPFAANKARPSREAR
jgi:hypothetical protein